MVDIQSATAEIRRGKKNKPQDKNIMPPLLHRVAIRKVWDVDELQECELNNGSGWISLLSTLPSDSGDVD